MVLKDLPRSALRLLFSLLGWHRHVRPEYKSALVVFWGSYLRGDASQSIGDRAVVGFAFGRS